MQLRVDRRGQNEAEERKHAPSGERPRPPQRAPATIARIDDEAQIERNGGDGERSEYCRDRAEKKRVRRASPLPATSCRPADTKGKDSCASSSPGAPASSDRTSPTPTWRRATSCWSSIRSGSTAAAGAQTFATAFRSCTWTFATRRSAAYSPISSRTSSTITPRSTPSRSPSRDPIYDAQVNVVGSAQRARARQPKRRAQSRFSPASGATYRNARALSDQRSRRRSGPSSPYGITKMVAEHYLRFYRGRTATSISPGLRYGNVYGPRQDPNGEAGVIAIFIGHFLARVRCESTGTASRRATTFTSRTSRRRTWPRSSAARANRYVIGTGKKTSVNEIYRALVDDQRFRGADRARGRSAPATRATRSSIRRKARAELDWAPSTRAARRHSTRPTNTSSGFRPDINSANGTLCRDGAADRLALRQARQDRDSRGVSPDARRRRPRRSNALLHRNAVRRARSSHTFGRRPRDRRGGAARLGL